MSKIQWCDETINPVVGCSKISAGCQNCYAENMARRLAAMGLRQYHNVVVGGIADNTYEPRWNGNTAFVPSELEKPYRWKKPRTIFVSSMGDLFHDTVSIKWQMTVMEMIAALPHHTFIFLTKRPENMKRFISAWVIYAEWYLPNLILGVSVEDQATADERIPVLLQTPAAKRFISLEPMIGPVDLVTSGAFVECHANHEDVGESWFEGNIHGVILGGESGAKGRRLNPQWVVHVRDLCEEASVPFMFKQWNYKNRNEVDPDTGYPWLGSRTHTELAWEVKP